MPAQARRCRVDAADVRPHRLARGAPGHDEVTIVGARALEIVDHEVAPMGLYRRFESLHRRQQVREGFGLVDTRHDDAAAPQSGGDLRGGRTLLTLFLPVHADSPPRLSIPRTCRRDSNTATAPPVRPSRPPHAACRVPVWSRGGWLS